MQDLAILLTPDGNLAPAWSSGKLVTPLAVGERLGVILAGRVTAGCRSTGATHLRYAPLGVDPLVTTRAIPADAATHRSTLLWTPDHQGALLFPAPAFAHAWWQTRRTAQSNGERVRGPLEELFNHVFLLLEDYEVNPELAEPTDLTAPELQAAVTAVYLDSVKGREAG
ncbi:hypothetical protein ACGFYO_17000 [Streptomyces sp. NPDC048201]|uniref:hypothetical protein n=1 Tax=Streptomyces sp. NPDC048201 TaxID=3365513 RepID=UPI003717C060